MDFSVCACSYVFSSSISLMVNGVCVCVGGGGGACVGVCVGEDGCYA